MRVIVELMVMNGALLLVAERLNKCRYTPLRENARLLFRTTGVNAYNVAIKKESMADNH